METEDLKKHLAELEEALKQYIEFKPRTRNQEFEKRALLSLLHLTAWASLSGELYPTFEEFKILLRVHGFRFDNNRAYQCWKDYRNLCIWKLKKIENKLPKQNAP